MTSTNCDKTYIQVAMPGSVFNAKNYSNICFRVGGDNCCYPPSPNVFSNTVCKPLPSQPCCPVSDPPDLPRCLNKDDLTGLTAIVSYDPSSCQSTHRSDQALFLLYINDIEVGQVDLSNGGDGETKSTILSIPFGVIMKNNSYKISLIKSPSISASYQALARIQILDENGDSIFDTCLENDSEIFTTTCNTDNPNEPFEAEVQNCQVDSIYSLKHKSQPYTGPVIRLRRSGDNAESDFYSNEIYDGSAENWVGSGNDGFIKTWYDQNTCNNLNIVQSDPNSQVRFIKNGKISVLNNIDPEPMSGFVEIIEEDDGSEPGSDEDDPDDFPISLRRKIYPNYIVYHNVIQTRYPRLDGGVSCGIDNEFKRLGFEGSHSDSCMGYLAARYAQPSPGPGLFPKTKLMLSSGCLNFYQFKTSSGRMMRGYSRTVNSPMGNFNFNYQALSLPDIDAFNIANWIWDKIRTAKQEIACLERCSLSIGILGKVFVP